MLFDIICMRWNRSREAMWFYQTYTQFLLHSHSNDSQIQLFQRGHPWSVGKNHLQGLVHRSFSYMSVGWSHCQVLNSFVGYHWRIQWWGPGTFLSFQPISFIFMQFSGKIWPNYRLAHPSLRLALPSHTSEDSWIRHWLQWGVHDVTAYPKATVFTWKTLWIEIAYLCWGRQFLICFIFRNIRNL